MEEVNETIAVIGLGRVGLPTSACLAEVGFKVYGIDKDKRRIDLLLSGEVPFFEPGMKEILSATLRKTFFPTCEFDAIGQATCTILCVNLPFSSGKADLADLDDALKKVAKRMARGHLVIIKTTLAPGMTESQIKNTLEQGSGMKAGVDFSLAYVPERLIEGQAIRILKEIPKIVGAIDDKSYHEADLIFSRLGSKTKRVSPKAAEVGKLLENCWRDITFAVANEAGLICSHLGIDALEAIAAANFENPWSSIPIPSSGVGGACLSKDPVMLAESSKSAGYTPEIVLAARRLNEKIPEYIFSVVKEKLEKTGKVLSRSRILLLGLAYKRGTDDVRNSPAETTIRKFKAEGALIMAFDPYVSDRDFRELSVQRTELQSGLQEADCIILMTNHEQFTELNAFHTISDNCIVADFWGLWDPMIFKKGSYIGWRASS